MAVRDVVQAAAGVGGAVAGTYIEDVFSTYLYTGNGTGQIIENGIALGSGYGSGSVKLFNQGTQYSYEILGDDPALNVYSGPFTIECWFYLTADPTSNGAIFAAGIGGTYVPISLSFYGGINTLGLNISKAGNWDVLGLTNLTSKVPLHQWHHCSVIYNGSAVGAYLNGTQFAYYATNTLLSSNYINIGSYNGAIDGFISDFRISNIARDSVSSGGSHSQSAWVNSATVADANTVFLSCRKDSPFTDSSSNNISLTVKPTVSASTFGPFDSEVAGEGGMVWLKNRSNVTSFTVTDTVRGPRNLLQTNSTNASIGPLTYGVDSFNATGFGVTGVDQWNNASGNKYASWTFRKAPKFFNVVTYTGDGVAGRTVAHNLGSVPGCIIIKAIDSAKNWEVYHRSVGNTAALFLNLTNAINTTSVHWNNTSPTENEFTLGTASNLNGSGINYVAYLFAHDAGGFGDDGLQNVISCGSYTGNGSANGPVINLGWEPQFVLIKSTSITGNWWIVDSMRKMSLADFSNCIQPNSSIAEDMYFNLHPNATGFSPASTSAEINQSGATYIYMAIRRPMKSFDSGTDVFAIDYQGTGGVLPGYKAPFPVDTGMWKDRDGGTTQLTSRLTADGTLFTTGTDAEAKPSRSYSFDYQNGWFDAPTVDTTRVGWMFRRAPGFHDVVAYTGTGSARTVNHNLGVAPEFIIVKSRTTATGWYVYNATIGNSTYLVLNKDEGAATPSPTRTIWNNTSPTSSVFSVGPTGWNVNDSGQKYIAYLFATLDGVSKVGSYSGTGADLNVDCGFSSGARFVLIKRTDGPAVAGNGDWYMWDSVRGIVSGNDPYLLLNSTAAEVTSTDYIDPLSSGFTVTSSAPAALNASGGTYIFLAIA